MADKFALEFGWKPASADAPQRKPYPKRYLKLAGLWDDTAKMQPKDRLQHFVKNGFVPARGDRGQLIFVDREGKPHAPHRILDEEKQNVRARRRNYRALGVIPK